MKRFADIAFTPAVAAAQRRNGSREIGRLLEQRPSPAALGSRERDFVATCESFFIATVGEHGWPYVQHRGGVAGFVQVVHDDTLALPDYRGNRQYVSVGNVDHDDRVALIIVDFAERRRLKLLGHARHVDAAEADADLVALLAPAAGGAVVERYLLIRIESFDWNCPQHIPLRYSPADLASRLEPLASHIDRLEDLLRGAGIEAPERPDAANPRRPR